MSKETKNKTRAIETIKLEDLHVSKLNMRHSKKAPDIDDIYPSILKNGVLQSLLVRKEGKGYGVIAGRRRYFALKKKAKETGQTVTAPCVVMQSGNVKAAREASLLENVARVPATQLEQFAAFRELADAGETPAEIATTFGLTELGVKRVLALANLTPGILALYEADKIHSGTVKALTLATHDQQAEWLKLYHGDDYAPQGEQLKAWLTGGARIKTDVALFEVEDYEGTIITDLFGETSYFQDPDLFWTHQNKATATAVEELKSDGWNEVVLLERGQQFIAWEHGKRTKEQGGKVFVAIGHDGSVKTHLGYLSNADIKKIDAILKTGDTDAAKASTAKPEMSGPLVQYVDLHRHAAIRASLLDHPQVALRVAVAHMFAGSDLWSIAPQKTTSRKETTSESVAASKGAKRFNDEQTEIYDLLGIEPKTCNYSPSKKLSDGEIVDIFARLLELDDATVMRGMTLAMCESLAAGTALIEAITYAIPVDMAALWAPDDAFFDILRDKTVINAMVKEIAGKSCADSVVSDTGKSQKQVIRNRMSGQHTNSPRPDWRPRWMQVPARSYLDRRTCPPHAADHAVSKQMAETTVTSANAA